MSGEMFSGSIGTRDSIKLYSWNSPLPRRDFPLHLMERVRVQLCSARLHLVQEMPRNGGARPRSVVAGLVPAWKEIPFSNVILRSPNGFGRRRISGRCPEPCEGSFALLRMTRSEGLRMPRSEGLGITNEP